MVVAESCSYENGELKWRTEMDDRRNEERIKEEKEFKQMVMDSITEGRAYRIIDAERQKSILLQVERTNGRVNAHDIAISELQSARKQYQIQVQDKKDANVNTQSLATIILTAIMAVSALVVMIKAWWR